jgi:hypothetical protein
MKKLIIPAAIFILALLSTGFSSAQSTETRNVSGFTKVSFGVAGDLNIRIGNDFKLVMEGDKDILKDIETDVSNGRLIIRKDNWHLNFNNERVTINLTMPEIEGVGVSGSGKAQLLDPVEADDLDLNVSGSGKIMTSKLSVDHFECGISGSGDVILGSEGSIDNGSISISGSGGFSGESIEIDHLTVHVSGSGSCRCKAGDTLEARISGSGNVYYSGNPKIDARVSGSGHVRSR